MMETTLRVVVNHPMIHQYLRKLNQESSSDGGFPTAGEWGNVHDNKNRIVQLAFISGFMVLCCLLIGWALYGRSSDPNWRHPRHYGLQDPASDASNNTNSATNNSKRMDLKQRQAYVERALIVKRVVREEEAFSNNNNSKKKNPYQHHHRHAKMIPKGEDIVLSEDEIKDLDNTLASIQSPWMCAICLTAYRIGDEICWSPTNPNCRHVFHHECIQEWLWKQDHCPCCRLNFINFEKENEDQDQPTITAASTTYETNSNNGAVEPSERGEIQDDEESSSPPTTTTTPTSDVSISIPVIDENENENDTHDTGREVAVATNDLENRPMQDSQRIMEELDC